MHPYQSMIDDRPNERVVPLRAFELARKATSIVVSYEGVRASIENSRLMKPASGSMANRPIENGFPPRNFSIDAKRWLVE